MGGIEYEREHSWRARYLLIWIARQSAHRPPSPEQRKVDQKIRPVMLHIAAMMALNLQATIESAPAISTSASLRLIDGAQVLRVGVIPVDARSKDHYIQVQLAGASVASVAVSAKTPAARLSAAPFVPVRWLLANRMMTCISLHIRSTTTISNRPRSRWISAKVAWR
jgi:hypothetical protein